MKTRTLYYLCTRKRWHQEIEPQGYVGFFHRERTVPLDSEFAFFTDTPKVWMDQHSEVIVTVAVPEALVRPWDDYMSLVRSMLSEPQPDDAVTSISATTDTRHLFVTPRCIPQRYWRMVQSGKGEVLWLPIAA